jgi:hypothetical protein
MDRRANAPPLTAENESARILNPRRESASPFIPEIGIGPGAQSGVRNQA